MRISTKTRYGMRFMLDLAERHEDGCVPMKDVAERQGISKKYLEQVVSPLSAAGLLEVTRGTKGGYRLSRAPEEITLAEVVSASEEGIELVECITCKAKCDKADGCSSRDMWSGLQDVVVGYLGERTLADAING